MASFNHRLSGSLQQAVCLAAGGEWASAMLDDAEDHQPGDAWIAQGTGQLKFHRIYMCCTPIWDDGIWNEDRLLVYCYRNVLKLVDTRHVKSLAVPLLATGKHRYPDERAIRLAVETCIEEAPEGLEEIHFTALDPQIHDLVVKRLDKELDD